MKISISKYPSTPDILVFSTERGADAETAAPYSGFSLCNCTGDTPDHIRECRFALCEWLGIDDESLITPRQTHSTEIAVVGRGAIGPLEGVDGLVTAERNVALAINTADCVPVLMADSVAGVIGAVHSGWRGTVGGIAAKCVDRMVELGASPEFFRVWMGPSICVDCFEVGEEVAEQFDSIAGAVVRVPGKKPHVDLGIAIKHSLISAGVRAENISLPAACSFCHHDRFFSARRLGVASGRTLSVIMRK
ncbi:MAG: peptidoglycan editing factor PgeF [Bacteroidales bacterium]|nr:peptidoglycan editing factor PgeF [Bacteroidales bacterium]